MTVKTEAKKYKCKQSTIDEQVIRLGEQVKEIENLNEKIEQLDAEVGKKDDLASHWAQKLKNESEKLHEITNADVVITVFEEDYYVNHPAVILSQTSLDKEDFYIDQLAMVEKALKLRDYLSEFYQHHNTDVRISVSINSI
jgi:hypothetical protein